MSKRRYTIDPRFLLIALLPVFVFLAGEYLILYHGNTQVAPTLAATDSANASDDASPSDAVNKSDGAHKFDGVKEATGRYIFYGTFLLFAAICVAAIIVATVDIALHFHQTSRLLLFAIAAGLAAIVVVASIQSGEPRTYWLAGKSLFGTLFDASDRPAALRPSSTLCCAFRTC